MSINKYDNNQLPTPKLEQRPFSKPVQNTYNGRKFALSTDYSPETTH